MTYNLAQHPSFQAWRDPQSGITSYLLSERVAPIQRHFYYTNASISADGDYLWIVCCFPPNGQRTLAVLSLDPADGEMDYFPQAGFTSESPLLCPDGDGCWFCTDSGVWRLRQSSGAVECVAELPAEIHRHRLVQRLATHLSLNATGTHLLLDMEIGEVSGVATVELATGKFSLIGWFGERHNHAQFSPHDPELFLVARDQQRKALTGDFIHHRERTFTMRTDGSDYACINAEFPCAPYRGACHEWWTQGGNIAFIDYETGVWEYQRKTGRSKHIWQEPLCHAHCDATSTLYVADQSPYLWPEQLCQVKAFNRKSGKTWLIDSGMPAPTDGRSAYHLDPHPQVSPDGQLIVYTSTQLGAATIAICPRSELTNQRAMA